MANKNTSVFKENLKLAWPISLQSILVTMLGMTDIMMVAHLGDGAVASVGIANRIQFVFLIILSGLATGVGILSAQYYGAGNIKRIKQVIVMTVIIAVLTLLPLVLLNYLFAGDIINLASSDNEVINTGESYLWVTMPSLLFVVLVMIFENALRGTGQVKFPMLLSIVAIFFNIILNYWLINGGIGLEPMGVLGAAWATTLARFIHISLLVFTLVKISHAVFPFDVRLSALKNRHDWVHFMTLVWPLMVSFGVWSLGTFVYQLIFGRMGTTELAVMSLLAPVEGLLISFFFGFASACSVLLGQRLGRDEFIHAWEIAKNYAISAPLVTFVLALLMIQFESIVFKPYASLSKDSLDIAHDIYILIAFGTCIKVFNMTLSLGILRAGGDNKHCMFIDFTGMWVLGIPLTFLAAFYFSLPIFWVVLVAYLEEICKAFMLVSRMKSKLWLRNLTNDVKGNC
jgi:putative MATE family efflux protein